MELGLYGFGEMTADPVTGQTISAVERMAEVIEAAQCADAVGLDVYGFGEHHRRDFVGSAPALALAAIAATTRHIRLTSTVSVLGTEDPVRLFQQFATLDLISNGRAEIMVGRGVFPEPFALFGTDIRSYDDIFQEKLELLLQLRAQECVTWSGRHRPALVRQYVYPRPVQPKLPIWVGVGGTPGSAVRAGRLGLPMALGIIGGDPASFLPLALSHRQAVLDGGRDPSDVPVSLNMHGFVADSFAEAADAFFPPYAAFMTAIGRERGWPPVARAHFDKLTGPNGSMLIGNPQQVAEKIIRHHGMFKNSRCLIQLSAGTMPHDRVLRAIELLGTKVAPIVRAALGTGQRDRMAAASGLAS
jgi:probable LLM family oxidoreductase